MQNISLAKKIAVFLLNLRLQSGTNADQVRFAAEVEWTCKKNSIKKLRRHLTNNFSDYLQFLQSCNRIGLLGVIGYRCAKLDKIEL